MQPNSLFPAKSSTLGLTQLADFAASMIYLMWHSRRQSAKLTTNGEEKPCFGGTYDNDMAYLMWHAKKPAARISYDHPMAFVASSAFKKFCYQVLSATQLKDSVVYLCLKYVAKLLQANPTVEGAEGSEYRLFVVALMLANKFLDDNTYTNKSWSEVSGMKVYDLNVMEAEFLAAIDFNLYVRAQEFAIWKILLDTCRQRYEIHFSDSLQVRKKAAYNTLHTLGLYYGQFSQDVTQTQPGRSQMFQKKDVDHIARITDLLDKSYKRYLITANTQEHQRKVQTYFGNTLMNSQQEQLSMDKAYRVSIQELFAPNQLSAALQPPAVRHEKYSNLNRCVTRSRLPITNLSQKSWDPLAYSLRCQGSYSGAAAGLF